MKIMSLELDELIYTTINHEGEEAARCLLDCCCAAVPLLKVLALQHAHCLKMGIVICLSSED